MEHVMEDIYKQSVYDKGIPYEFDNPYQGIKYVCVAIPKNVKYTDGTKAILYYNIGDSQIINMLQTGQL